MITSLRLGVVLLMISVGLVAMDLSTPAAADPATSNNYRIDESFIGPGGNLDSSSSGYQLQTGQSSLGNTGVGESTSAQYSAQAGATTTNDPRLSCVINSSALSFGSLSTSVPATGTATFSVLNYTSYGYAVSVIGTPPTNGGYTLNAMGTTATSSPGSEQFGINLKANTTPSVGAEAVQNPSSNFSSGAAASGYATVNQFRYVNGETIASAARSSGQTDYTISYIINVANTTPGGQYSGNQTLLCTGTY